MLYPNKNVTPYRKMTIYGHFSIQSRYFCLDTMVIFLYNLDIFVWILQHGFHFGSQQSCYKAGLVYYATFRHKNYQLEYLQFIKLVQIEI